MKNTWKKFQDWFVQLLKGQAVRLALKRILGTAAATGPWAWLVTFIVVELTEEIAEPFVRLYFRSVGYNYYRRDGERILERIERAKEEGDQDAYDTASDDILNS